MSFRETGFGRNFSYKPGTFTVLQTHNSTPFNFGTGDFTYAIWAHMNILPQDGSGRADIISKISAIAGAFELSVTTDGLVHVAADASGPPADDLNSTTIMKVGVLYHFAVTRASGTLRLYVNGTLENSTSNSANVNDGTQLTFGGDSDNTIEQFNGTLDEAYVYNVGISATAVKGLADGYPGDATGLILHYDMETIIDPAPADGFSMKDLSGHGENGFLPTAAPVTLADGAFQSDFSTARADIIASNISKSGQVRIGDFFGQTYVNTSFAITTNPQFPTVAIPYRDVKLINEQDNITQTNITVTGGTSFLFHLGNREIWDIGIANGTSLNLTFTTVDRTNTPLLGQPIYFNLTLTSATSFIINGTSITQLVAIGAGNSSQIIGSVSTVIWAVQNQTNNSLSDLHNQTTNITNNITAPRYLRFFQAFTMYLGPIPIVFTPWELLLIIGALGTAWWIHAYRGRWRRDLRAQGALVVWVLLDFAIAIMWVFAQVGVDVPIPISL